jgi:hypothetical protein
LLWDLHDEKQTGRECHIVSRPLEETLSKHGEQVVSRGGEKFVQLFDRLRR